MKKNSIYYSALFLLVFFTMIIIITNILFILGFHISYFTLLFPFILSIILLIFYKRKESIKLKSIGIGIALLIIIISSFASYKYLDLNWDSNTYHKDAVGALKNGWNPVHQKYLDFYKEKKLRASNIIGDKNSKEKGLYQSHYCQGIWIVSANFYYLYGNIEQSKIFNLVMIYITIVFSYFFVRNFTNKKVLSFFLAILFSLSPVAVVQAFSYYNDGALYSALLMTVLSFILFMKNDNKKELFPWIFSSIIICVNIKFTGLAYGGFICFILYLGFAYIKRKELKELLKPTLALIFTALFAVLIAGFNPYVTNTINNHHPFYPIKGENSVDIMKHNTPQYFEKRSRIKNLAISLLSETDNIKENTNKNPKFKVPFSVNENELFVLGSSDARISGFGVWFAPLLIISSLIIIYYLLTLYKKEKNAWIIVLCLTLSIILLCLIIKESWWARYTPYIYMVPCLATFLLVTYPIKKKVINYTLFSILYIIAAINLSFYFIYNIEYNYKSGNETKQILNEYKKEKKTIQLIEAVEPFSGCLYNLDDNGIKYNLNKSANNKKIYKIFKTVPYTKE